MADRETRPFVCEICEARFTSKQFLKRHSSVHSEERKFKCEMCSLTYKYRKGLNRHYRKSHNSFYVSKVLSKTKSNHNSGIILNEKVTTNKDPNEKDLVSTENYFQDEDFQDFICGNMDDDYSSMLVFNDSKIFQASPFPS